jgi:hypothetical protein
MTVILIGDSYGVTCGKQTYGKTSADKPGTAQDGYAHKILFIVILKI